MPTFTYDVNTDVGRVRRTLPDNQSTEYIWSDEEIQSFIDDEGDWRRATALALETMASDNALVMWTIKIQNIETRSDRVVSQILLRAAALREQAAIAEDNADGGFDVIPLVYNDFGYRRRIIDEALKAET